MKKFTAVLLSFIMVLGLFTTAAWANPHLEIIGSSNVGKDWGSNTIDGNPQTFSDFGHGGSVFYKLPVNTAELSLLASSDVYRVSSGIYQISPGVSTFKVSFAKSSVDAQRAEFISTTDDLYVSQNMVNYAIPVPEGANVAKVICTNLETGNYDHRLPLWIYEVSAEVTGSAQRLSVLLNTSETVQLSTTHRLQDNADLTWKSTDPSVATVAGNGKVTATSKGLAYIYAVAEDGSFKECIPVRVVESGADGMRLAMHLLAGQKAKLYLTEDPSQVTWTSLDETVAVVSDAGVVKGVGKGLAIVQAELNGRIHQIYVRVNS